MHSSDTSGNSSASESDNAVDAAMAVQNKLLPASAEAPEAAEDFNGKQIDYPNTWQLTNGNPEEHWQAILIYLEARYGNQKNKSIIMPPYEEDISNLDLYLKLNPDRLARAVTKQNACNETAKGM